MILSAFCMPLHQEDGLGHVHSLTLTLISQYNRKRGTVNQ